MNEQIKDNTNCSYCGWKFPRELLAKIKHSNDSFFCENCGAEILVGSNCFNDCIDDISDTNKTSENLSHIYDTVQDEENSIARVLLDSDYPNLFKDNLKIVISRLLYPQIQAIKFNKKTGITQEIIDKLYEKIRPIMDKKVMDLFLYNLHELSDIEFLKWLKLLQDKIKRNNNFHNDFIVYLHWMIREVYIITTKLWNKKKLPKFERIIRDDLKSFISYVINTQNYKEPSSNKTINLQLREKLLNKLNSLMKEINCAVEQQRLLQIKSFEILDQYLSNVKKGEINVRKDSNLQVIAATILYTVLVSHKNMPSISISQISSLKIAQITNYYRRHFQKEYPRLHFNISSYDSKRFRKIFSLYFFKIFKDNSEIEVKILVKCLCENILNKKNLPNQLSDRDVDILKDFLIQEEGVFIKYFSDLGEIVKQIMILSRIIKKLRAQVIIKFIAKTLEKKNIDLDMSSSNFSRSIAEIYDFLKQKHPRVFPPRAYTQKRHNEFKKIVGSKMKLYIIREILGNKNGICPECSREGLKVNTSLSRLKALHLHHMSDNVENKFSAKNLYRMFSENLSNPKFLDELTEQVKKEDLKLLCNNHHTRLHDKYYEYFKYLISWEKIFSYPPEIIQIIIRISVDSFHKTKTLSIEKKKEVRRYIRYKLKKRFIIEHYYGEYCHICGEFSTRENLPAFQFAHLEEELKSIDASSLYKSFTCSEVARILIEEKGGYICGNCHSVLHNDKLLPLLDKIFKDRVLIKKIKADYNHVKNNITLISKDNSKNSIGDPLKTSSKIYDSLERYLIAIYEISELGEEANTPTVANYLKISNSPVHNFFKKWRNFLKPYIKIKIGLGSKPSIYILTEKGKEIVSLLIHFRNYFLSS